MAESPEEPLEEPRFWVRLGDGVSAMGPEMAHIAEYILPRADRGFARFDGRYIQALLTLKQRKLLNRFLQRNELTQFKAYDQGDRRVRNLQPNEAHPALPAR